MLRNSPPAQQALMLLDHDPQVFWQALQFYLRFSDPRDVATALRASVASLDAENRSQLALFIAGPDAGSHQLASSREALNTEIRRISTQPTFKASVEKFLRANPRAVGQLSSRLLQELLVVAENPQFAAQRDGSTFFFAESDRLGVRGKHSVRFDAPGWILPLGAFFVGSIVTAFVISWLFGRVSPGTQSVITPVYLTTAQPLRSSAQRRAPTNGYALPAQSIGQPVASAPPPGPASELREIVGSAKPALDRGPSLTQRRQEPSSAAASKAATPASARSGGAAGALRPTPASSGLTPAPDASEIPFTVQPENQIFVAVPKPSPAAAASMDPSALILTGPTPERVRPTAAPSPAPTATPAPRRSRKRIRLGYHCAKCH